MPLLPTSLATTPSMMTLLQSAGRPPTYGTSTPNPPPIESTGVGVADAGQQPHERGHVAAEHLDLLDLRPRDDAAVLRFFGVDMRAGGLDGDGVVKPPTARATEPTETRSLELTTTPFRSKVLKPCSSTRTV